MKNDISENNFKKQVHQKCPQTQCYEFFPLNWLTIPDNSTPPSASHFSLMGQVRRIFCLKWENQVTTPTPLWQTKLEETPTLRFLSQTHTEFNTAGSARKKENWFFQFLSKQPSWSPGRLPFKWKSKLFHCILSRNPAAQRNPSISTSWHQNHSILNLVFINKQLWNIDRWQMSDKSNDNFAPQIQCNWLDLNGFQLLMGHEQTIEDKTVSVHQQWRVRPEKTMVLPVVAQPSDGTMAKGQGNWSS